MGVCAFRFRGEVKNECNVITKKQTKNQTVSQQSYIDKTERRGKNKNIQNAFQYLAGGSFPFSKPFEIQKLLSKTTFHLSF